MNFICQSLCFEWISARARSLRSVYLPLRFSNQNNKFHIKLTKYIPHKKANSIAGFGTGQLLPVLRLIGLRNRKPKGLQNWQKWHGGKRQPYMIIINEYKIR